MLSEAGLTRRLSKLGWLYGALIDQLRANNLAAKAADFRCSLEPQRPSASRIH